MHDLYADRVVQAAVEARRVQPTASALAVLEKVLGGIGPLSLRPEVTHPATSFGQLVAEAFDAPTMTPAEWMDWAGEGSEATLRDALLLAWNAEVMPKFRAWLALAT